MITYLKLRNFRAFRDQDFHFKKLNIFVGANSTGKSSAISAINFIAQSATQSDPTSNPLSLNGPFERLGTFKDVIHGNHASTPIGLEIGFRLGSGTRALQNIAVDFKYRSQRREIDVLRFEYQENGEQVYQYTQRKDKYDILLRGTQIEEVIPTMQKRRPTFGTIFPLDHNLRKFSPIYATKDLLDVPEQSRLLIDEVDTKMRRARFAFKALFDKFDCLSPFREQPQRTYMFTGETPSRIGMNGANSASILVNAASRRGKQKDYFIDMISDWFRAAGVANELILHPLTDRHFEIRLKDLNGRSHNICDVGFGCSQVLPVLSGAVNLFHQVSSGPRPGVPIFVVQEPEIHLHPNAQATLGSFFVSLLQEDGQIFIETHSDNLILRIARHVAEQQIAPSDVRIFRFENGPTGKRVQVFDFTDRAAFTPPWPGGFFPQREHETIELARSRRRQTDTGVQPVFDFNYPESA